MTGRRRLPLAERLRQAIHQQAAVQRFREHRYQRFVRALDVKPTDRIVDVGSGPGNALESRNRVNPIVAVDVADQTGAFASFPNVTFVRADARALPFGDRDFDIAFSHSVIEHVLGDDRRLVAAEIARVAERYWVQTPNRWFPIEPHYMVPLYQFLPRWFRRRHDAGTGNSIELLGARELRLLFPDARIERERFLGLTKSLIAVRR